jgi:hypothetical protein
MREETFWIIAVHPINGVNIEKIRFTDRDEEFLNDDEEWDSFDDYVEHGVHDIIGGYMQRWYSAVAVKDAERLDIIKSLSDE